MKIKHKSPKLIIAIMAGFIVLAVAAVVGLSQSVANINQEQVARQPEAILASAGVSDGADISLPVAYYDQRQDACVNLYDISTRKQLEARQFEWSSCGYGNRQLEQGMVDFELGKDYLPVATGGELLPNRGLTDMRRWYSTVEGQSQEYTGNLHLVYRSGDTVEFSYANNDFYPLDSAEFSAGDSVNADGHNHLFTMSLAVPFVVQASGQEAFEIAADDDTFVYVGGELALDMGGIHDATTGKFTINEAGEVYTGIGNQELAYSGITVKGDSIVRIFHADRDAGDGSVFRVRLAGMNLNVVQTQLASGADGVQVAYDPTEPGYVGPLGESTTVRPDGTRAQIIIATIMGVVIATSAIFVAMLARNLVRSRK